MPMSEFIFYGGAEFEWNAFVGKSASTKVNIVQA